MVSVFHVLHYLFQSLLILDVHLIADVPFPIPIVDHDECGGCASPRVEVALLGINPVK